MKKTLMVILALVMALTLVLGSVSSVSAAPTPKPDVVEINITKVVGQTVYYNFKWSLQDDVATYAIEPAYENGPSSYQALGEYVYGSLDRVKSRGAVRTKYTNDPTNSYHNLVSGDKLQFRVWLYNSSDEYLGFAEVQYTIP